MTDSTHPVDVLADWVDGHLSGPDADRVRLHVEQCASCRAAQADLELAKRAVAALRTNPSPPADLHAAVVRLLDAEDREAAAPARVRQPSRRAVIGWLGGAAAALVLAYLWRSDQADGEDVPAQAARAFRAAGTRSLPLAIESRDAAEIGRYFEAEGLAVRVIDLGMMGITLEGAVRHTIDGRPSALYTYRTASGGRLACQMFGASLDILPPPQETRSERGFRFQIYSRGDVSLVFWQEGSLVCVLASDLPLEEVAALALAKAMAPA